MVAEVNLLLESAYDFQRPHLRRAALYTTACSVGSVCRRGRHGLILARKFLPKTAARRPL